MKAIDHPFAKIISGEQGAREHYHVPKYQRAYTWGRGQWEQLYQDIDENDPGYFMGSLICVKNNDPQVGEEQIYDLIDGQQRMTTLSLFMMALYKQLKDVNDDVEFEDEDDKKDFCDAINSIQNKLIKKKKDHRDYEVGGFVDKGRMVFCRVQPSSQGSNLDDFIYILSEIGLINQRPKPSYCGVRLMYKAFAYFQSIIPKDKDELLAIVSKINELVFVFISADSQSSAFTLFESLNNRGVPLSPIDIIKNTMLAQMERQHGSNIDESYEKWQRILRFIPESDDQERFLRHFYNAFKVDPKIRVEGVTRATRSKVINVFEELIKKRDAKEIFDKLNRASDIYGNLLYPGDEYCPEICSKLEDLDLIGAAPAYQVLLYLFSLDENCFEECDFLSKAIDLICKYYVRRNITDIPSTRHLDSAHIEVIEACDQKLRSDAKLTYSFFQEKFLNGKGKPASLETFQNELTGSIYNSNSWMTRYLLVKLDASYHSREYKPDFWGRDEKGRLVWTIEHVFPQGENIPEAWVKMIADGDRELANKSRESHVHRLGNLTLSGYNSNLSAASFDIKQKLHRDRTFLGHTINIGYMNGLALNNLEFILDEEKKMSLANAPVWKLEMIESRTTIMSEKLVELFKFPDEEK